MACQCLSPGSMQHIEMLENTLQHAAKYQAVQTFNNLLARFFNVILKKKHSACESMEWKIYCTLSDW